MGGRSAGATGLAMAALLAGATGAGPTWAAGRSDDAALRGWTQAVIKALARSGARNATHARGRVLVRFTETRDGSVGAIKVQSAASPALAALGARVVRRAAPLPPIPAILARDSQVFTAPLHFH